MSLHKFYNPNPARNRVGDCTVRAIYKATGQDWNRTYCALAAYGLTCKDMPSANSVWGRYLRELGFRRNMIDDDKYDYTVEDFCKDNPKGAYIRGHKNFLRKRKGERQRKRKKTSILLKHRPGRAEGNEGSLFAVRGFIGLRANATK